MWPNPQESVDLVTFTAEMEWKKIFFCTYSFCKTFHVKCIVNLYYMLYQNTSRLSHIWNYVYSGTLRNFQAYSALLRHVEACWGMFLMRYIQDPVKVSHTHNLALFQALADGESEAYWNPVKLLRDLFRTLP